MFSSIHSCRRRRLAAWGVSSDLHGSDAGHQGCSQRWDRGSAIIVGWRDQCGLSVKLTSYDSDAGKKHVICWFVLCFWHWSLRGFTMAVKRPRGSAQVRVPLGEQEIADRRTLAQWISEPRFLKTCRRWNQGIIAAWQHDTMIPSCCILCWLKDPVNCGRSLLVEAPTLQELNLSFEDLDKPLLLSRDHWSELSEVDQENALLSSAALD